MPTDSNPMLTEMEMIRKLLVLALLRSGMTQGQLGAALGVHRTQIGRMFPAGALSDLQGKPQKAKRKQEEDDDG